MAIETIEQGTVDVGGECVRYEIRIVDARSTHQREQDVERGRLEGNLIVVVPGHGQSVFGPKKMVLAAAQLSRSKLVWCIDPVPARGGDRIEGRAITHVVRDRISAAFPATDEPVVVTLIGWSHGGGEALHAANHDPALFSQFLGLCPTGLVDRTQRELLYSFFLEANRILWTSVCRRDWACLLDSLRLGWNAAAGMVRDLWRGKSLRRVFEDIGWASRKVTSGPMGYSGEVVLLFGAQDTVVRWQDAFPECELAPGISNSLAEFQQETFPLASRVEVRVIEGAHVAPEVDPPRFLQIGLGLLGQWDDAAMEEKGRE